MEQQGNWAYTDVPDRAAAKYNRNEIKKLHVVKEVKH